MTSYSFLCGDEKNYLRICDVRFLLEKTSYLMNSIFFGKSDEITTFHFLFGFLSAFSGHKQVVQLLLDRRANRRLKVTKGKHSGKTACIWNRNVDNIIPSCN